MKKRVIAGILAILVAGSGAGCGSKAENRPGSERPGDASGTDTDLSDQEDMTVQPSGDSDVSGDNATDSSFTDLMVSDEASDQRNEYVIYCPDETLPDIFVSCYPGYKVVSEPTGDEEGVLTAEGEIGDMKIHWVIADYLTDDEKAGHLDELLIEQQEEGASEYDWIDLFVIDEVNIEKYIGDGVDVSLDLRHLGIRNRERRQQYSYTRTLASDGFQELGASFDVSPGVFLYRRSVANAVLGTDDPGVVGESVRDWENFRITAEKTGKAGYKMLAGYDAAFDVYSQAVEHDWQSDDGSLQIDEHLMQWVETTDDFVKKGICGDAEIGSDEWMAGITGKGDVFGYFLSAEEIELIKDEIDESNTDSYGDWGIVPGPAGWYRGGSWLCAAVGSPNPNFSAEIIRNLTCNEQVMQDIYEKTGITVNNRNVLLGFAAPADMTGERSLSDSLSESADGSIASGNSEESDRETTTSGSNEKSDRETATSGSNGKSDREDTSSGSNGKSETETATSESFGVSADDSSQTASGIVRGTEEFAGDAFRDPFFAGQQTGPVYDKAANAVKNPVADWERWTLDDMFQEAYYPYFRGECSLNDALASFYQNAKGLLITEDEEW